MPVQSQQDLYHYAPTKWVGVLFLFLFGFSAVLHLFQALRYKLHWLIYSATLCGVIEALGWAGRTVSAFNLNSSSSGPYILQSSLTLFAPTAILAVNFILLARLIARLGPAYSRLNPRLYSKIFLTCDIVALLIQCTGGGMSATKSMAKGGDIALTGVIFQFVAIICYITLAVEFFVRYAKYSPVRPDRSSHRGTVTPRVKQQIIGMGIMTVLIVVRSIYRTVELVDGWTGKIASTQWLFVVFDALMIALAMYTLHYFHPGRLLVPEEDEQHTLVQYPKQPGSP
ncbi:RTA1 like protein-domain-containing protein [Vararia minispora EC-137]|uniref:RTA1 like protein-domain-containing protein n=1 Tax=Vararia minispora EC-137 TaxID=1314806 RepID=A0ACB8QJM5_9AGAM|nr:RTA1 like protein-domain-containing protein [Vararia minispora EC-137]